MTIREFLRAFLLHACGAFLLWFALCVAIETFMPGFVTPFIDVADFGLAAILASTVAILLSHESSASVKRWIAILAVLAVCVALIAVLALAITPGGRIQLVLIGAAVATAILVIYAFLTSPSDV